MKTAIIDIGHGGSRTGAFNNYVNEKDINLVVGLEVCRILAETKEINVVATRYHDVAVTLEKRCEMANNRDADIFVSIHHNATGIANSNAKGYEVIHSLHGDMSKYLALCISEEFEKNGRPIHKVYSRESEITKGKDYYYVIRHTKMPAVITEYGYMDTDDYEEFRTIEQLYEEASAIAKGIYKYILNKDMHVANPKGHWCDSTFEYLNMHGIKINEKRFDEKITRAELFALLKQVVEKRTKA